MNACDGDRGRCPNEAKQRRNAWGAWLNVCPSHAADIDNDPTAKQKQPSYIQANTMETADLQTAIVACLTETPDRTNAEIRKAVGIEMSPSGLLWHLHRMAGEGRVYRGVRGWCAGARKRRERRRTGRQG